MLLIIHILQIPFKKPSVFGGRFTLSQFSLYTARASVSVSQDLGPYQTPGNDEHMGPTIKRYVRKNHQMSSSCRLAGDMGQFPAKWSKTVTNTFSTYLESWSSNSKLPKSVVISTRNNCWMAKQLDASRLNWREVSANTIRVNML